jgi:hypothetical protein
MSRALKPGDRVHVTVRNRMAGYHLGDTGTVLRSSVLATTGQRYYSVAMDKDDPTKSGVVFSDEEIDPDV